MEMEDFVQIDKQEISTKEHEFYRDFLLNRKKEYFNLEHSKVRNKELQEIILKLSSNKSLQESLELLDNIPQSLMYSLILEEFRQNPESK